MATFIAIFWHSLFLTFPEDDRLMLHFQARGLPTTDSKRPTSFGSKKASKMRIDGKTLA